MRRRETPLSHRSPNSAVLLLWTENGRLRAKVQELGQRKRPLKESDLQHVVFADRETVDLALPMLGPERRRIAEVETDNSHGWTVLLSRDLGKLWWSPTEEEPSIKDWQHWLGMSLSSLAHHAIPYETYGRSAVESYIQISHTYLATSIVLGLPGIELLKWVRKNRFSEQCALLNDPVARKNLLKEGHSVRAESDGATSPDLADGYYYCMKSADVAGLGNVPIDQSLGYHHVMEGRTSLPAGEWKICYKNLAVGRFGSRTVQPARKAPPDLL